MNYLSGALSYIAGNDEPPSPSSSSTTSAISRLVDRTASSALPADRRSAVAALAELALRGPDAQREIGARGIKVLYAVIEQDGAHEDTVTAALTLLARICGGGARGRRRLRAAPGCCRRVRGQCATRGRPRRDGAPGGAAHRR